MVTTAITVIYYLFCAYVTVLFLWNFIRAKNVYTEILYGLVMMPFLLRLLRLK